MTAAYFAITGGSISDLAEKLSGTIYSRPLDPSVTYDLEGLTLVFTTPSATVTFSDNGGSEFTLAEAVAEINAVLTTNGTAFLKHYGQAPELKRPALTLNFNGASGITLSHTGTANELLGLSTTSGDSSLSGAPIAKDRIIGVSPGSHEAKWGALIGPAS